MKYKLYYFDSYGVTLRKLLHSDKTFNTLEDAKHYLYQLSPKWVRSITKHSQIIICEKNESWRIIEIIENDKS